MGGDDERRRRKSRKQERGSRSKRGGERDDRRRRDDDGRHHKERSGGRDSSRHERKSSRDDKDKDDGDGRSGGKLTAEEERLLSKAREYLDRKEEGGGGRKHDKKEGKRRRSESYDDSGDGSGRHARRHHKDRKERKRSRRDDDGDRDKKSRHKKKSKHSHRDEERASHKTKKKHGSKAEESAKVKATPIDPSKLASIGEVVGEPPSQKLDPEESYFSHNSHLRLYLYRTHGIYFEDLTSSQSHTRFKEFAKAYNSGDLEKAYYDPSGLLPQEALDQCQRTKHRWKFNTNKTEEQSLEIVRAGVKKQTEYNDKKVEGGGGTAKGAAAFPIARQAQVAPRRNDEDGDGKRRTPAEVAAMRQSDKRHRERIRLGNEEIHGVSKSEAGSFERKLEKRREQSDRLHGAARDRESEAWGGAELDDDAIYGGGGTGGRGGRGEGTYEEAVAKQRKYRERRDAEKAARTSELLGREEEKRKKMFEMLGLSGIKAGEKIKIAPRND